MFGEITHFVQGVLSGPGKLVAALHGSDAPRENVWAMLRVDEALARIALHVRVGHVVHLLDSVAQRTHKYKVFTFWGDS